jgi:hypothetical protein
MLQSEVKIGGQYIAKVGRRYATVTVLHSRSRPGQRTRFVCLTEDTRREITATAARLSAIIGTPEHAAAEARDQARRAKLAEDMAAAERRDARPFDGPTGTETVEARPLPGLVEKIGPAPVLALSTSNRYAVARAVDAIHVAEKLRHVVRVVRAEIGRNVVWQTIPRALRRGIVYAAAFRHASNRNTYRAVMRHDPLPSPRAVAEAVAMAVGLGREPLC